MIKTLLFYLQYYDIDGISFNAPFKCQLGMWAGFLEPYNLGGTQPYSSLMLSSQFDYDTTDWWRFIYQGISLLLQIMNTIKWYLKDNVPSI